MTVGWTTSIARFRVRSWSGEEAVAYDTRSGDLHLLEALSLELLRELDPTVARSTGELLEAIRPLVVDAEPAELHAAVLARLQTMRDIGLVSATVA